MQLAFQHRQRTVLGLFGAHQIHKLQRLLVVSSLILQEILIRQIHTDRRIRMVFHELDGILHLLGWRGLRHLLPEVGHQLVGIGPFDLHLFQMRCVGCHFDGLSWFSEDGLR